MAEVKIKLDENKISRALQDKLAEVNDTATMLAIHNTLAKRCDPYVPMLEGPLSQTTIISAKGVTYTQPYAAYQYYGEVYGPNIPIIKDGIIIGWFSPPGKKKHPTGRPINYSKDQHPLASAKWDEAMLRDHGEEFYQEVKDIIRWRVNHAGG